MKNGAESKKTCLLLAVLGLLGSLGCLGWSWFSYDQGRTKVLLAIEKAGSTPAAEQAMAHIGEVGAGITLWLALAGGFLAFGAALLVLGLLRLPETQKGAGSSWSAVAATLLISAGFGLGLLALADYLRFDDFFQVLWLLT